jgi:hypothetical protein
LTMKRGEGVITVVNPRASNAIESLFEARITPCLDARSSVAP